VNVDFRYLGRSGVKEAGGGTLVSFAPNLARPKVFFDGALSKPLRFREAVSALHDVVVGDLKSKPKDRTAWLEWKKQEAQREVEIRQALYDKARKDELARIAREPIPPDLESQFRKMHRIYWDARVRWANELARNDPELFRHLVPCDPVVTVAPDVVFFECFSKDESSYGCLSVDRGAFQGAQDAGLGTTNVDYSLALYEHFQTLRSYRETRLLLDPAGFEVSVAGREDYREEKIDLPPSWLRGFGQIQAAMCLPSRRVEVPIEAVYAILAYLKRRREKTGPRSLRFQLTPGKPPVIFLDPWGIPVPCRGVSCEDDSEALPGVPGGGALGPYRSAPAAGAARATEEIKVWGRRRLFALARLLPLADRVEVRLLGSGLPSLWIVHMGEMRFALALSGWTVNDWTSGSNLDLIAGALHPDARMTGRAGRHLEQARRASFGELAAALQAPSDALLASLHLLAKQGQVIYDHAAQCYRYRQVMPVVLSDALLGPEHPELVEGRRLAREAVDILRDEALAGARRAVVAKVKGTSCEAMLDADSAIKKARCTCSYFYKNRLRAGPCRHLLAVRLYLSGKPLPAEPGAAEQAARTAQAVPFPPAILEDMGAAAKRTRKTLAAVLEEAWDASFERIQSCRSWAEAVQLAGGEGSRLLPSREVQRAVERPLPIHADVMTEIRRVAERFRASPAAVVGLAWLVAKRSAGRR
jgi:hypothetical protein